MISTFSMCPRHPTITHLPFSISSYLQLSISIFIKVIDISSGLILIKSVDFRIFYFVTPPPMQTQKLL